MLIQTAEVTPHFRGSRARNPLPELPQTPHFRTVLPQTPISGDNLRSEVPALSKAANYDALDGETVATLLGVSTRQLSTYVKEKGCPCVTDGRQRSFVWTEVLSWYVGYKISLERYSGQGVSDGEGDDPIRRKDTAIAGLKELELEQRRGKLVTMAEVSRVFQDVTKGLQTEILGLPTRITGQVLAIRDQQAMFVYLSNECSQLCTRLSQLRLDETKSDIESEAEDVDG